MVVSLNAGEKLSIQPFTTLLGIIYSVRFSIVGIRRNYWFTSLQNLPALVSFQKLWLLAILRKTLFGKSQLTSYSLQKWIMIRSCSPCEWYEVPNPTLVPRTVSQGGHSRALTRAGGNDCPAVATAPSNIRPTARVCVCLGSRKACPVCGAPQLLCCSRWKPWHNAGTRTPE